MKHLFILLLLLFNAITSTFCFNDELCEALINKDYEAMHNILKASPNDLADPLPAYGSFTFHEEGITLFHAAVLFGDYKSIEILFGHMPEGVSLKTIGGRIPLDLLYKNKNQQERGAILQLLIDKKTPVAPTHFFQVLRSLQPSLVQKYLEHYQLDVLIESNYKKAFSEIVIAAINQGVSAEALRIIHLLFKNASTEHLDLLAAALKNSLGYFHRQPMREEVGGALMVQPSRGDIRSNMLIANISYLKKNLEELVAGSYSS